MANIILNSAGWAILSHYRISIPKPQHQSLNNYTGTQDNQRKTILTNHLAMELLNWNEMKTKCELFI